MKNIGQMLKQAKRGLDFSEENLALDVLADVGPGGMFMSHRHTRKHMRSTALLTQVADRDAREAWTAKGAPDVHTRAMQLAREILARDNPAVFAPEVDERIRAEFEDLIE